MDQEYGQYKRRTKSGTEYYDFENRRLKWPYRKARVVITMCLFVALLMYDYVPEPPEITDDCSEQDDFVHIADGWRVCSDTQTDIRIVYTRHMGKGEKWTCENDQNETWIVHAPIYVKYLNRTSHTHEYKTLTNRKEVCIWTYMDTHG